MGIISALHLACRESYENKIKFFRNDDEVYFGVENEWDDEMYICTYMGIGGVYLPNFSLSLIFAFSDQIFFHTMSQHFEKITLFLFANDSIFFDNDSPEVEVTFYKSKVWRSIALF